ncbi:hypothetical protein [Maribacter dokdonensis]|uniref:hypothetical protein n=1 Tax=Maribacter dokdonensis TaxID=320912 RepID=UPI000724DF2C|nr:hypothetical protein [Maribacter dokdonensis]KSA13470.1 hypothetical protein I600_60 [Maribacter dokdonensis DSW-8]
MKGRSHFTSEEAKEIEELIALKLISDGNTQKGIRANIRRKDFYASDFGLSGGYTVADFRSVVTIGDKAPLASAQPTKTAVQKKAITARTKQKSATTKQSDEAYIIDLCDEFLKLQGSRQHRFDFLRGDSGTKLPVDAYYPSLNLVIEYYERQHSEAVPHFDKRMTVSGISRGEQRKLYDERRRTELPKNGIDLIIFDYTEFQYTSGKRLIRQKSKDLIIIESKLKHFKK